MFFTAAVPIWFIRFSDWNAQKMSIYCFFYIYVCAQIICTHQRFKDQKNDRAGDFSNEDDENNDKELKITKRVNEMMDNII